MNTDEITVNRKVAGQMRSFYFGPKCWGAYCKMMNIIPGKVSIPASFSANSPFKVMRILVFCAANAANKIKGKLPIQEKEVYEWMDEDLDGMASIVREGMNSLTKYLQDSTNHN